MVLLYEILLVIFIVILGSFIRHYQIRKQYPPGPLGLPFVGQLPLLILKTLFHKYLPKISEIKHFRLMKEKYGPFWSISLGNQRITVLASFDLMNEAFVENGKLFSGRSDLETFKIMSIGKGFTFVDGQIWQNDRQLGLRALRDLGMERQQMEGQICNEVEELIAHIGNNLSKPLTNPDILVKPVINVISRLVFHESYKYDDPQVENYARNLWYMTHSSIAQQKLELFSKIFQTKYTRKIFPEVDQFIKSNNQCIRFITDKCRSRMKIEGEYAKPSCVFDYFWRYRYQDQPEIGMEEKLLNISHSMFDIFFAGSDTVSSMLGFCFVLLGLRQGLQEELRTEIQSLVDDYKHINMEMRKNCPRLLSFIDEIQRYCHVVPKVFHRAIERCTFKGYKIESNDIVFGDLGTISRDPTLFENPDVFDPYRFLDSSKTKYIPCKYLIPFGIGKRSCMGESIAMMELFLILSKVIQKYQILVTEETKDKEKEILEGDLAIIHAPLFHEIYFQLYETKLP